MSAADTESQQSTISLPFMEHVSGGDQQSCAVRGHPSGNSISYADSCLVTFVLNAESAAPTAPSSQSKESKDPPPGRQPDGQYRWHESVCQYTELDILVNAQYLFSQVAC